MAAIEERQVEVAGTSVLVREAASQTPAPVVYLHGVPTDGRDWLPFLERTGGIAPDLPGFGRSDKSAGFDYSIDGYTRFLTAFVDELNLSQISLLVHDWGAVGLMLAQARPDLIHRLVIVDAVPFTAGYRWHRVARIWRTPLGGELFMGATTKFAFRWTMRMSGALPADKVGEWADAVMEHFDHGTQRAILRLYRSAPPSVLERAGERLGDVRAPTLIVWGDRDPFLPTKFAHAFGDALGGEARVEVVDGAGHWPWIEQPRLIDEIAAFFAR
jgi:pimeloyl-ACP methyl ester carboxylesterase